MGFPQISQMVFPADDTDFRRLMRMTIKVYRIRKISGDQRYQREILIKKLFNQNKKSTASYKTKEC